MISEKRARQIIEQVLLDNGHDTFVGTDQERYESSCSVEELARQIAYRLDAGGAFRDDDDF